LIAQNGSPALYVRSQDGASPDPFLFVGAMWVGTDFGTERERYYPKYPSGFPALVALAIHLGGPDAAYWVNPLCTAIALLSVFLLVRFAAGSFSAFLGTVVFASSPMTFGLAGISNSHASALLCVTTGMCALLRWWRDGGIARAAAAGIFFGLAATIRYTEMLLLLPIVAAIVLRPRNARQRLVESAALLSFWLLPIATLLCFNLRTIGKWTGYDSTHESTGFALRYFMQNWHVMLQELNARGAFFVLPLALVGMISLFGQRWRLAVILTVWAVPGALVYTFYYWAPENIGLGYLRFFLTILPALTVFAFTFLSRLAPRPAILATALVAALSVIVSARIALPAAEDDQSLRIALSATTQGALRTIRQVPADSLVFARDRVLLHQLQFSSRFRIYDLALMSAATLRNILSETDDESPQFVDPARRMALANKLRGYDQAKLDAEKWRVARQAIAKGKRVFFLVERPADEIHLLPPTLNTVSLASITQPLPPRWQSTWARTNSAQPLRRHIQWNLVEIVAR
jgi:4-amino-4-deoxy-L-arabinose transferase-like glycosyltransferase